MNAQLIMPQEVEVFYVIPALRREMALAMKAAGKKQKAIAGLLCVKESTISQYINEKRATWLQFNDKIRSAVANSVARVQDKVSLIEETQKLLRLVKDENALCEIHRALADVPETCNVCVFKLK